MYASYVLLRVVRISQSVISVEIRGGRSLLLQHVFLLLTFWTSNHACQTQVGFLALLSLLNWCIQTHCVISVELTRKVSFFLENQFVVFENSDSPLSFPPKIRFSTLFYSSNRYIEDFCLDNKQAKKTCYAHDLKKVGLSPYKSRLLSRPIRANRILPNSELCSSPLVVPPSSLSH